MRNWLVPVLAASLCACAGANVAINKNFDFSTVKRVAVLSFKDFPRRKNSGEGLATAFDQSLLAAGYSVAERSQILKVQQDQHFNGNLDPKTSKALAAALGVDALVYGQVTDCSEPKQQTTKVNVVNDQSTPTYTHVVHHVQLADGTWTDISSDVPSGTAVHRTTHQETHSYTVSGHLAVSARMVSGTRGEVAWSATSDTTAYDFNDASRELTDNIMKALKKTWPGAH